MTSRITLPEAPVDAWQDGVAIWSQPLDIDTYDPLDPDPYPAFLDQRVYQGSSGRVYPMPFHERISQNARPRSWQAVHLENQWIRLVVLPELGGRVHIAYDKVAEYDIFYRNNVIKPALVGLAGPWISGGIEFNWPQHHRPATYLPTDFTITREEDGSATVWCSDHDPFARMKGMHGIRLAPDSSRIEVQVRLFNRTEVPQTFLWWANVAAAVNDDYQSFFPSDVTHVADHAKRAVVTFPRPDAPYYGIDYAARAADGSDADRLDWYRNIPVPTSYMALGTSQDFFGGYDHGRQAGFVHVADHEISPGKKQWTWGNSSFGHAWDRNLTDDDGPYVELMAGVFTDNQPDFAYLAAGETKTFSQTWYPIRDVGPVLFADRHLALSVQEPGGGTRVRICPAQRYSDATITVLDADGAELAAVHGDLCPGSARVIDVPGQVAVADLTVVVTTASAELAHVPLAGPAEPDAVAPAAMALAPPAPSDVPGVDQLVRIATYLEQYRHATRSATAYLEEALRRDPHESRALLHLGRRASHRGETESAIGLLGRSAELATEWTSTPVSGEAHYHLGLALDRAGRVPEAARAFSTAMWDSRHAVSARFALARLRSRAGRYDAAEDLLRQALESDPHHLQCLDLLALTLRVRGREQEATDVALWALHLDPLDAWAKDILGRPATADATVMLDVALEYVEAGFVEQARAALDGTIDLAPSLTVGQVNVGPLAWLHLAALDQRAGDLDCARQAIAEAAKLPVGSAHPSRLADAQALELLADVAPDQALPASLLGHWLYDRGRHLDAIARWEQALGAAPDPALAAILHRNLGIAEFNIRRDPEAATAHYARALELSPAEPKLRFEADLLAVRTGVAAPERLAALEPMLEVVARRDDLTVSLVNLLLDVGRAPEARDLLVGRRFQPWEGGEGQVLSAWDRANVQLAQELLARGAVEDAQEILQSSIDPPRSLGEGRHPLANVATIHLARGDAFAAGGDDAAAAVSWEHAARSTGDFVKMAETAYSVETFAAARALLRLGRTAQADALVADIADWLEEYAVQEVQVDFFATSLPELLVFHEDPAAARDREVARIREQLADWDRQRDLETARL
ncbi:DUF5107 domain-containing protein [Brachybacterium sacelli]|uniref:Tetratricopeptide (TPR) repeat protein n=1 Tax=Brachybacterium sacelli TaxID=173364 RepID=A0ABS4WYR7_9MICO|nr:DUF5107 domain-containing protein [Brachybacterium sacelli]MBP2381271.1 tetratricopeptide (TPR) repeat protein [Brachybacterium sacelli]